ncbi:hypothetical protein ACTD5D_10230 [Nocardia takedensis]|uniref:hypothetical protein n=1 Tax=Nocardia takedensis TaxID=259390 RepID=UPI003F76415E
MPRTSPRRAGRIDALKALIAHPRTPPHERDTATAMLKRLLDHQDTGPDTGAVYPDSRWYGEKYDTVPRYCATSVISKAIRTDIRSLRRVAAATLGDGELAHHDPIGDAPAAIRFTVTTSRHGSITITVRDIPDDWGWVSEDRFGTGHATDMPSPALQTLGRALRALADAYNHDGSDSTTDYYDQRFFLSVSACKGQDLYGVSIA